MEQNNQYQQEQGGMEMNSSECETRTVDDGKGCFFPFEGGIAIIELRQVNPLASGD